MRLEGNRLVGLTTVGDPPSAADSSDLETKGLNLQACALFSRSHKPNFLKFRPLDSKECGHLDKLSVVREVFGVRAELFQSWAKLTAGHRLWYWKTKPASAVQLKLQTEFTNLQYTLLSGSNGILVRSLTFDSPLRVSASLANPLRNLCI